MEMLTIDDAWAQDWAVDAAFRDATQHISNVVESIVGVFPFAFVVIYDDESSLQPLEERFGKSTRKNDTRWCVYYIGHWKRLSKFYHVRVVGFRTIEDAVMARLSL